MDVLAAGFVLGVGATWLARRRRLQLRGAVGWTARQAGLISGQVSARVAEARRIAREQYEKGRAIAGSSATSASIRDGTEPGSDGGAGRNGAPLPDHRSTAENAGPRG
jgi:hypothetical protein